MGAVDKSLKWIKCYSKMQNFFMMQKTKPNQTHAPPQEKKTKTLTPCGTPKPIAVCEGLC